MMRLVKRYKFLAVLACLCGTLEAQANNTDLCEEELDFIVNDRGNSFAEGDQYGGYPVLNCFAYSFPGQTVYVSVRSGARIDRVDFYVQQPNGSMSTQRIGTETTGGNSFAADLSGKGKYIKKAIAYLGKCNRSATRVCGLAFYDKNNKLLLEAGQRTNDSRTWVARSGYEVIGAHGSYHSDGDGVASIGFIERMLNKPN